MTQPPKNHIPGDAPASIGPYRIERLLGAGGMGAVYLGHDDALRRRVAIKQIQARHRDNASIVARFQREARALAAVEHPGVVAVHTVGTTDDGLPYLAMEYVEGIPLTAVCTGPWPIDLAVGVVHQAAAALGAAHVIGIVHRDVKPDNLLIDEKGQLRVVDFGLARRSDSATDQVTEDNAIIGTVPYMAPEQLMGGKIGSTVDVFALGIVLYQLVTGVHPFARDSRNATAVAISAACRPPLRTLRAEVPEALAQLIDQCLSTQVHDRPADGTALAQALAVWAPEAMHAALAEVVRDPQAFRGGLPAAVEPGTAETLPATAMSRPRLVHPNPLEQSTAPGEESPPRKKWWILPFVALIGIGVGWWLSRDPTPSASPAMTAVTSTPTAAYSPIRRHQQTVAILDFDGAAPGEHAVLADRVRVHLEWIPADRLRVVSLTGLGRSLLPTTPIDGRLDVDQLKRPDDAIGAIDWAVRGTVQAGQLGLVGVPLRGGAQWRRTVQLPSEPAQAVAEVAAAIAQQLGLEPPQQSPYRVLPGAYAAYLNARAAERLNQYDRIATDLTRAFDIDPDLAEGRCMHVGWLYGTRQLEELEAVTTRLIDSGRLNPRQLAFMEATRQAGRGDVESAVRALEQITLKWPFFVDAQNALLAHRFHNRKVKNLEEVERLARRALAFFPRGEHAASRLVRAMAFRGQADAAKDALLDAGLTPETRLSNDVWAEVYLYTADYERADKRFSAALAMAPQDIYARNMRYVARILADRCQLAASDILEDVAEYGIRKEMKQVGWVGRLGIAALACQQDWAGAHALLDRWAAATPEGQQIRLKWIPRLLLAADTPRARVLKAVEAGLAEHPKSATHASLLRTLARVETRVTRLKAALKTARSQMTAAQNPRDRHVWSITLRALQARVGLLISADDAALAEYKRLISPWAQLRSESELELVVEMMAMYAEALAHAGRGTEAKRAWQAIAALHYPRIKAMDLAVMARAR